MKQSLVFLLFCLTTVYCQSRYTMGQQGQSCNQVCFNLGLNCNPKIVTDNSFQLFAELGVICTGDNKPWSSEDQPSYVSDKNDPNYGECRGYIDVPTATQCSESSPSTQRLCRCDDPSMSHSTFGTGYSGGTITTQEKWIFEHVLAPGDVGVLTHFWITYATLMDNGTIIRYYVDGEKNASIEFTPSLACGVGFYDAQGPWGTEWFGKGADNSGWYNNFKIPFQKSIVVTTQHLYGNYSGFYMIVRGSINLPITVGGEVIPKTARMNQFIINETFQPFDWITLANITSGPGVYWMTTISAATGNLLFLEGCIHAYFDGDNDFPGVLLSTGTEDYFDSAWYFDAGLFHLPVSGFTHLTQDKTSVTWSAYRFHDQDPLFFNDGFQLVWRNGDLVDAAGLKCHVQNGGSKIGAPTAAKIFAYGWAYTWPA